MKENKEKMIILKGSSGSIKPLTDILSEAYELVIVTEPEALDDIIGDSSVLLLDSTTPDSVCEQYLQKMEKEGAPDIPVVAVTKTLALEDRALKAGVNSCISPPFNKNIVMTSIDGAVANFRGGASEDLSTARYIVDKIPCGVATLKKLEDGSYIMTHCNQGLAELFKYPDRNALLAAAANDPMREIVPDDKKICKEMLDTAVEKGIADSCVLKGHTCDGDTIWVHITAKSIQEEDGSMLLCAAVDDVTKEQKAVEELSEASWRDSLTGLYRRSAFFIISKKMIAANPDKEYSILRLNIGSFKLINDLMGRETGDDLLLCITEVIKKLCPEGGVYARFIADTFAILVPTHQTEEIAENILSTFKVDVRRANIIDHDVQVYIGIYHISENDDSLFEDMCDRAQIACRSITGSYRNHIAVYDESMRNAMLEEQDIRDNAHKAIKNHEFCVYYQPVYGIQAKRFVSAEALVRWKHPTKGLIPPGKFISIFEKNGFIAELDLYVLEEVCKYQQKRREHGLTPFPISVNISRKSLYNPNLFEIIYDLTKKYGVEPKYFRIEITETAYNDNPAQLLDTVHKLREKSFPVLMDDFGSGYSSLNTLKDIPIDLLKLDMKFMQGFEKNTRVGTIVTSVARMSRWLNVPMLAEGVETREQYMFLRSIGCSYIQGFYFARPSDEEEFTRMIGDDNEISDGYNISSGTLDETEINDIMTGNVLASELISMLFGGLGIYELNDGKLDVIRVNEGYMKIMGYSAEDLAGENNSDVWSYVHPDDVEISRAACRQAIETGKAVKATIRRYDKNGRLLMLEGVHKRLGGSDSHPVICIAFNDITDSMTGLE